MSYALPEVSSRLLGVERFDIANAPLAFDQAPETDPRYAFAQLPWLCAWEAAYTQEGDWHGPVEAYAVYDEKRCLGMVALANQRLKGFSIKSLAGYYWPFRTLCASADPYERTAFAAEIAVRFTQRPPTTILRFGPVATRDEGMNALLSALRQEGWIGLRKNAGSTFHLDIPVGQAHFADRMSGSLYKNIQYLRRRLHKQGIKCSYERYRLQGQPSSLLRELQKVERASWVSAPGGHMKFLGLAEERFYAALTGMSDCGAQPVVWIFRCAGEPVAFSFHIEAGDTIYIVANSYDEQWKHYSPGSLLTYEVLIDACARNARRIDWGRGDSGYKSRWGAAASEQLCDVLMFSPGVIGRAACALAQRALPDWEPTKSPRSY